VAGTNGKGSFCAMLGSVLRAAGFRAGVFTSPHLERFNERFKINDVCISDEDFGRIIGQIASVSRLMFGAKEFGTDSKPTEDSFSFFEILTIMAFIYFDEQKVDFLVLEVGIGGRLDSTNVLKSPLLSVIMAIGFDHMNILGNTLEEIAKEKGGIIKENRPLVLYDDVPLVYNIFKEMAKAKNAKIYHAADMPLPTDIELGLKGRHQADNAGVVLAACEALRDLGFPNIDDAAVREGLKNVHHAGRMEIVSHEPLVILDGAHNLPAAKACADYIKAAYADKEITLVLGIMSNKDYARVVETLAGIADRIVFTKPLYDARAVCPNELTGSLRGLQANGKPAMAAARDNCIDALELARKITPADGVILCTGSLYLVGDLRKYIKGG
jgi:dihydrofolate synthase/folylpolyglutamate synthase